ncbi:reverse transcriptase domain-containing protein [Tanacetum coccineum]
MEAQYGKFLDMIRAVRINVHLIDVLAGMPNYGKFLKELISNKHKIEQYPVGIDENMIVEVGKFTFPADFVILEMEEDSKVPLILGRPFLYTVDAVIRVKQKQLNLGVRTERMIFNIDSVMKHSYSNDDTCYSIDVIDEILEEDFDDLLNEGSKILNSIKGTLLEEEIFAEFDEFMAMTADKCTYISEITRKLLKNKQARTRERKSEQKPEAKPGKVKPSIKVVKSWKPREEKKSFRQRDEKKGKSDRKCFRCGDPNHLIGDCPKPSRNKDQKAFIRGSWSDSENDAEDKTNDETCLMAQSSNEVCLRTCLDRMSGSKIVVAPTFRRYGGNLYTLVVVDDYLRYTWTRFLKTKNEAFEKFEILSRKIQNQLGSSIIAIRTDHGQEFDNEVQFGAYCDAQGITHNFLAPRTPQSNGIVERKNRTLQEMSRTMLNEQSIP